MFDILISDPHTIYIKMDPHASTEYHVNQIHEYSCHIHIIYKNDVPVGYVHSRNEAEMICEKNEIYQWDRFRKKQIDLLDTLPFITFHDCIE